MTVTITTSQAPPLMQPQRSVADAMLRGMRCECPACGVGNLYRKYLKVADHCLACGEAMHHQRADDAPPYFTMFIVGHIVVAGILMAEKAWAPSFVAHLAVWLPLTVALSLMLLPVVKGALIGLQWALRMHGFGEGTDPADPAPIPDVAAPRTSS